MLLLALSLSVAACGQQQKAPSGAQISKTAQDIALQTEQIARDVARTGRDLVQNPQSREAATSRLRDQEGRARKLADRARRELPDRKAGRQSLIEANQRTAETAARLQKLGRSQQGQADLDAARQELMAFRQRADRATQELRKDLSPSARRQLDDLRKQVPDLPQRLPSP